MSTPNIVSLSRLLRYAQSVRRGVRQTDILPVMGAFWKRLRVEKGLGLLETADSMGINPADLELFERGLRYPDETFVDRLAATLGRRDCLPTHTMLFEGY